jgi:preflagellin peptidase FlaK
MCEGLYDPDTKELNVPWLIAVCVGIGAFVYQFIVLWGNEFFFQLLVIPILILVILGMYEFRLLHGGADAKALMALTLLIPFHPVIPNLPIPNTPYPFNVITTLFPFPMLVLFNAVILFIFVPLILMIYNFLRGDRRFPHCLLGYMMDIDDVPKRFVWLMEKIEDGNRKFVFFQARGNEEMGLERELEAFKMSGVGRVWVTHQYPFMVPLTIGLIVSITIGFLPFIIFSTA